MTIRSKIGLALAAALLVAAPVVSTPAPAQAASCTHYVATTGNDSNSGTLTAPWRKVQKAATSAPAGAVVCVRGGTYAEKVVVNVTGTSAAPITFQNYPGEVPVLDGTGLSFSGRTGAFSLTNKSYITISGFEIRNYKTTSTSAFPSGIWVQGTAAGVQILDNRIHDIKGECQDDCGAHAIAVYGTTTGGNTATLIKGNEVYNNLLGWSEAIVVNGNVSGFEIANNVVRNNSNIGIDAIGYEGECASCGATDRARNGAIRDNTVTKSDTINNWVYEGSRTAGGIYVDGGTEIVIERNVVTESNLGIEIASEHQGKSTSKITVRNNFVSRNHQAGIAFGGYDEERGSTQNSEIVNNTLYDNATIGDWGAEIYVQFDTRNNTVKNNIIYTGANKLFLESWSDEMSGNVIDRNLWYTTGGGTSGAWTWKGTSYSTFAAYKTGSGNDATSLIGTDPKLVSTTTPNLHLQATSPAKNAGVSVGTSAGTVDIDGQNRVQGVIDIGADEVG